MSPIIKKRGERFTIPSKYLLFILTIICTGLMVLTFSTNLFNKPLNAIAGYVIIPFQKGISSAGGWISTRTEELKQIKELLSENEKLKKQVDELTIENVRLSQDKYELNNLQSLYKLDQQYDDYEKVGARVIARDSGNWYHSFTIDKGSNDGIIINMNVIADGGLVGRVIQTGPNWSKVISIISDQSNISGKVLASGDNLIVSGDLEMMQKGLIRFSQLLDSKDAVREGDKIVTSNISDIFLPNILIGYINDLSLDANKLTKSGTLTPTVDFEHMDEVLIILKLKQEIK